MNRMYARLFTVIIILICLTIVACGKSENLIIVDDKNVNMLMYKELPGEFDQFLRIDDENYIFLKKTKGEAKIGIYSIDSGIILEKAIHETRAKNLVYDEKNQRVLLTISKLLPVFFEDEMNSVIAFDMDLNELWRIEVAPYIIDIVVDGKIYYIVCEEWPEVWSCDDPPSINTVVSKVDADGKLIKAYRKNHFEYSQTIISESRSLICGTQTHNNKREAVLIEMDGAFFSERHTILKNQDFVFGGVTEKDTLILMGAKGAPTAPFSIVNKTPKYYINIMNLNNLEIVRTIDVSRIFAQYDIFPRFIFYGENKGRVALIAEIIFDEFLMDKGINLLFIPIDSAYKLGDIYAFNVSDHTHLSVMDISESNNHFHIFALGVDYSTSYEMSKRENKSAILEFQICIQNKT